MARMAPLLLWLLLVAGVAIVLGTSSALPATVATHFGAGGHANGWMSRIAYQVFYSAMMIGITFAVYAAFSWLPRRKPHLMNLPNRDYWLAEPRREASMAALRLFGVALALSIVGLLVTIHFLILDAHTKTPPRLDETMIFVLLGGFVAVVIALVVLLNVRFRSPR
jgi:uncharacterized membrane protein